MLLVVDDDAMIRELLAGALAEELGLPVAEACDGGEAVELALRLRPKIVLLDWMLPVRDGDEVARLIRAAPELADTVVIAVSAVADYRTALAAGCDDCVRKPFDLDYLVETIRTWLRADGRPPLVAGGAPTLDWELGVACRLRSRRLASGAEEPLLGLAA